MHFGATLLAALAVAVGASTDVVPLRNIDIGVTPPCGSNKHSDWVAWFNGDYICETATDLGPTDLTDLCDGSFTIGGHSNITFTGCRNDLVCRVLGPPTGISLDGHHVQTCCPTYSGEHVSCRSPCEPHLENATIITYVRCTSRLLGCSEPPPFVEEF